MNRRASTWWMVMLALVAVPAQAVEILRWERLPLAVPLVVGQERIVFIDRNVRVGFPARVGERLRVQSAGGAVYLRASEPIEPTRLQLQDADTGALILLDIAATPAQAGEPPLEPVRIVEGTTLPSRYGEPVTAADSSPGIPPETPRHETPLPVVLTRFAAQNLYAPLRTVEPLAGIQRVNLRHDLSLDTLLPTEPIHAKALVAWRLADQWVTAVRLTNTSERWIGLDPRALQGDFMTASFQHPDLGPRGMAEDTTVLYLVTRGHGLAQSLLPAINRIDPALNLPRPANIPEGAKHAQ
ncbi:TIGR03749 family integrating conjugative element protein [Marinobacterium rhizophilum]|uniref:TIGR03749 family integrating conjugative element protein n=1 Tax=Marinobacterium rhizophilum TaxID=420402 RepID=UPI00039B6B50|nr:TIGR03749 family integrating conjugative element protein [Marinobacterium rhizophilum]